MNALAHLLAACSYLFHELMRGMVQLLLLVLALSSKRKRTPQLERWRSYSEDCGKPGFLPVASVIGPRWNCHAMVAGLGPVDVQETIACPVHELSARADSWSLVVYDQRMRTVAWTGSCRLPGEHASFALPAGRYSLSLRFYAESDAMLVPDVLVDGRSLACGRVIEGEATRYAAVLESVRGRQGWFYRALHYYVFHFLKYPRARRDAWLRQQFLPVGNPDTEWSYGSLAAGERLAIASDPAEQAHVSVYVAFYNWASFPEFWCRVGELEWLSPRFDDDVAYAVRRIRRSAVSEPSSGFSLRVIDPL